MQALVEEHIKQIKDKRLPQVINEAVSIFKNLTNGTYNMIHYTENHKIHVKHSNEQVFEPVELSQSTKELLYVALRISLIKVLKPYYPFPVIVDDAFVHFDKYRKERMLKYLRELSEHYQILYFTCTKDHVIPAKEVLTLNKLQEGGKNEKCRKIKSRRLSGSFFLIHRATQGVTAQGKDYMTLFLQDKSGDIEAKLWTATKDDMQTLKPETIVHVKGDIINYRGRKQMKIHQIRLAQAEDKVSTKDFVDGAPMSPTEIQEELSHFMLDIENANLQRITRHLIKSIKIVFHLSSS